MKEVNLPHELQEAVSSEKKEFVVRAKRLEPVRKSIRSILGGFCGLIIVALVFYAFFAPLFKNQEVQLKVNGVETTASSRNFVPLLFPGAMVGLFLFITVSIIMRGIYGLLSSGGIFVGTPTRLLEYRKGKISSTAWGEFSGDMIIRGEGQDGDLVLKMKTGKMLTNDNGTRYLLPDEVSLSGIMNHHKIAEICRDKIKEHAFKLKKKL